jgi:putative ABC transport system permease protein
VRLALGATRGSVIRVLISGAFVTAAAGTVAGLVLAVPLMRPLEGLLFGVPPLDPSTFAAAAVLSLGVAALACALPAWRASRAPIVAALRVE